MVTTSVTNVITSASYTKINMGNKFIHNWTLKKPELSSGIPYIENTLNNGPHKTTDRENLTERDNT